MFKLIANLSFFCAAILLVCYFPRMNLPSARYKGTLCNYLNGTQCIVNGGKILVVPTNSSQITISYQRKSNTEASELLEQCHGECVYSDVGPCEIVIVQGSADIYTDLEYRTWVKIVDSLVLSVLFTVIILNNADYRIFFPWNWWRTRPREEVPEPPKRKEDTCSDIFLIFLFVFFFPIFLVAFVVGIAVTFFAVLLITSVFSFLLLPLVPPSVISVLSIIAQCVLTFLFIPFFGALQSLE